MLIPFPGKIGNTIVLPAMKAIPDKPQDGPAFQVGDICEMGPSQTLRYRFRVTRIEGDDVYFERIS